MDKRTLYDGLTDFEASLTSALRNISAMKDDMKELIKKNNQLEIENQRLRERLEEMATKEKPPEPEKKEASGRSRARVTLEKLYEDGFHVCNTFYGQRRENDAPCMWCIEILERK